ncbi:putative mediator of RNA polymerase II transcription subunit 16 [Triangularia setosa]|uniref:Mediator of RNA polymerase II transcription subunit 16 n=1 Tax=Triangularia setosa TaxID=2587417 RepID=A0AAN6W0G2_9PEZI|nr:putative mediator of RNA polymerase II transcription subunit 16 [Podospora setosa]
MSAHDMSLLGGDSMSIDAGIQGMQGIQGMDGAMALDDVDLFGDPVMDNALGALPLTSRPPPSKQLQQRLDQLRARGCCQGIAWGRLGSIACISKDGMFVDIRYIRCNPENGEWDMNDPSSSGTVSLGHSLSSFISLPSAGAPIVHVAWAPTTHMPDLAVIDGLGRITILTFPLQINRPYPARKWDADPVDDLHSVVGCHWLPIGNAASQNRGFLTQCSGAHWAGSEYKYNHMAQPAFGPSHPHPGRSALVCVTTNGLLRLFYQSPNNRFEETALELESVTAADDLITHASFCCDKQNTLLIALATASKQLRVLRVAVNWGNPPGDKQVHPGSIQLRPSMKEMHVAAISWLQHGPNESALDFSMAQLSHVIVLPSFMETSSSPPTFAPAAVVTVRSYLPHETPPYGQEPQSIIDRWEVLNDQAQAAHPAFEQLGSRNGAVAAPPAMTRLRKLEPVTIPKVIISMQATTMQLGRVICFTCSDGTVQYRDRFTMAEVYNEHNTDNIISPHQVGFQFEDPTPCLQVAFSPSSFSFVQICEDGTLRLNRLRYTMGDLGPLQDVQSRAVLAALTMSISFAWQQQMTFDDILAVVRPFTQNPKFTNTWLKEIITLLRTAVDYSEEQHQHVDTLIRNTQLQSCLSLLNHFGFNGNFQPRSFHGKFASVALNLRNIIVLIVLASQSSQKPNAALNPLDESDVVDALVGCAEWAVGLFSWLMDSLFNLLDDPEFMVLLSDQRRFQELASYLHARNDVSVYLLLCSSTRSLLQVACRRLSGLEEISSRALLFYKTRTIPKDQLHYAYQRMYRTISTCLVKPQDFERLLSTLSRDISTAYQRTLTAMAKSKDPQPPGATEQQQQQSQQRIENFVKTAQSRFELEMLSGASPPNIFREVLARLFTNTLPTFKTVTDPAKLYFANYDLLEVNDDAKTLRMRKEAGQYVDVFKRVELVAGQHHHQQQAQSFPPTTVSNGSQGKSGGDNIKTEPGVSGAGIKMGGTPSLSLGLAGGFSGNAGNAGNAGNTGNGAPAVAMTQVHSPREDGGGGAGNSHAIRWRRCVRCASVMEDIMNQRPGFTYVLAQQRKCCCGGAWALVAKGALG